MLFQPDGLSASISGTSPLQREINKDLVLEGSYIGNYGAWLQAGGNLISYNAINPSLLQSKELDITNAATRTLCSCRLHQALRQFPRHGHICAEFFNPFNRMEVVSDPSTGAVPNPPTRSNGELTSGFGYMNCTAIGSNTV
jgi:hypothetical protein